jgi:hypothetical protein
MGTTHRFLAIDDETQLVIDWFRGISDPPEEIARPGGLLLYFRAYGGFLPPEGNDSGVDCTKSPLVSFFRPQLKRGVLWTAGEVHFLPTPLATTVPKLNSVSRRLHKWLGRFDLVFSRKPGWKGDWNYYLEGSLQNFDQEIFALPRAMEALRRGQYFVADGDNDFVLDRLCRQLKGRGVVGIP